MTQDLGVTLLQQRFPGQIPVILRTQDDDGVDMALARVSPEYTPHKKYYPPTSSTVSTLQKLYETADRRL